ncbi:hypothetical protein DERF_012927 [Dermatophagoides farinae]|uniref:Uncharacterized protein n=1 Tax=Dermatophagoides farinae TaxID=6954 RepID=A0A922HSV5_DERFA|nr:hypothetical protein DERF_012927 [Dermatophagoides farinae]
MIIGGQIPGRTIEQNLTSEARDGFAMSWRSAFRAKPHERSEPGWFRGSAMANQDIKKIQKSQEKEINQSMDKK